MLIYDAASNAYLQAAASYAEDSFEKQYHHTLRGILSNRQKQMRRFFAAFRMTTRLGLGLG
jgi:hypothetical protein